MASSPNPYQTGSAEEESGWIEHIQAQARLAELDEGDAGFSPTEEMPTWEDWREYLSLISWLIPDVYRHARLKTLGVVILSALGVAARAATAGTLLLFVHAQNEGRVVELLGWTLPSDPNPLTLLAWGGATCAFAVLTVLASYSADQLIFDLGRTYMENSTRRVMRYMAAGGKVRMPDDLEEPGIRPVMQLLVGSTFRLVRVVIQSLSILLPLITLVAAASVLIWTNALLTGILLPILVGYGFLMSRLNRQVMRDSQRREFSRRIHSRDVSKMVRTLQVTRYPAGSEPEWLRSYPERSWMVLAMNAFRGIVLAKRRVDYLGDVFQGVALLAILMVFGTYMTQQGTSWAVLLTYLVALGYATKAMGRASKCVTTANRFLPQVRRYFAFIDAHPDIDDYANRVSRGFPDGLPMFRVGAPALPESAAELQTRGGEPILCFHSGPLRNPRIGELCFALAGGDAADAVELGSELFFLRGMTPLPEREVWEFLPSTEDRAARWSRAVDLFRALGVLDEFREQLGGPDGVMGVELDERLSHPLRLAIRLLPGVASDHKLFVLGWDNLEPLTADDRRAIFETLSDRVILVVPTAPMKEIPSEIAHVLVTGPEAILGIGDTEWYTRVAHGHLQDLQDETEEPPALDLGGSVDYDDEEED